MWGANGTNLTMAEGDFGISLPFTFTGVTFAAGDAVKMIVKADNGSTETLVEKTVSDLTDGFALELTEAETTLLSVGSYVYSLDWYRDGVFMCNLVPCGLWKVVDKV